MLKRYVVTPVFLVALVLLLCACNRDVHAKRAPQALPTANNSTVAATTTSPVALASPAANATAATASTAITSTSPVTATAPGSSDAPVLRHPAPVPVAPAPVLPTFVSDPGAGILFNRAGFQRGSNTVRSVIGTFPATSGFVVHIICQGYGLIRVEVSSGIYNELSCPQPDNANEYYTSSPTSSYAIRVTTMGSVSWRVVVEGAQ